MLAQQMMAQGLRGSGVNGLLPAMMGTSCQEEKAAFSSKAEQFFDDIVDERVKAPESLVKFVYQCFAAFMAEADKHTHEAGISESEKDFREVLEEMRDKRAGTNSNVCSELINKYFGASLTDKERHVIKQLASDVSMKQHAKNVNMTIEEFGEHLTNIKSKLK